MTSQLEHVHAAVCYHQPGVRGVLSACWPCKGIQALDEIERTSTNRGQFFQSKSSLFYSFESFHRLVQVKNQTTVQEKVAEAGGRKTKSFLSVSVVLLSTQIINNIAGCEDLSYLSHLLEFLKALM